jgi:hypothetical protein
MIRGSEAIQLLQSLLKPTLLILVWMSGLRLLLYLSIFHSQLTDFSDVPAAFFAGFRFDLLVLGFFWIPVIAFTWLSTLVMAPLKLLWWWKIYFVLVVLVILGLSWLDFFWTVVMGTRINSEFFLVDWKQILDQGWDRVGGVMSWGVTLLMGLSALALSLIVFNLKIKKALRLFSATRVVLGCFLSFLLVAFAARGTWTPHHLNIETAQVSGNLQINQIPLNAVWNLDK